MSNKYIILSIIISFLLFSSLKAETIYFGLSKPDISNFPYVSSSFTAIQASGYYFDNITNNDFIIKENGKTIPASDISVDCKYDAPVEYLLMIDNSASMDEKIDGKRKMDWVIKGAEYFIDNLPMDGNSNIAIVSFNSNPTLRCDFTSDKKALKDSLAKIGVVGAPTDFNYAFLQAPDGGIETMIRRPIDKRRVIIFLTDGRHTQLRGQFKTKEIIDGLKNNNINCFPITFLDTLKNEDLSAVAAMSGGNYEFVSTAEKLDEVLSQIGFSTRSKPVCLVTWKSYLTCDESELFRNLDVSFKRIANQNIVYQYKAPAWSIFRIKTDKQVYDFGNPAPGDSVDVDVILQPNLDVTLTDFLVIPSTYFRIIDYGNNTYTKPINPVIIKAGETRILKLRFKQGTPQQPRYSVLYLEGTPCPTEIPLVGGRKQIVITNPKENDVLSACDVIDINWTGIDASEVVKLYYSTNNGSQWFKITDNATGGNFKWTPPKANAKYKLRALVTYQQTYKWAISDGGVADEISTSIDAQNNELFCTVSGNINDTTAIDGNQIITKGGTDMFVAKYDADGKMRWLKYGGSKNDDNAAGAVMDATGNVYLTGKTYNEVQFDSQTFGLARIYSPHIFLAKFSTFGNFLKCVFVEPFNGTEYFESYGEYIKFNWDGVNEPRIIIRGKYKGSYFNSDLGKYLNEVKNWTDFTCEFNPSLELKDIYNGFMPPNTGYSSKTKAFPTNTVFNTDNFSGSTNIGGFGLNSNGGQDYWISKQSVDARNEFITGEFEIVVPQMELLYNFIGSDSIGYHNDSSYIDLGSSYVNVSQTTILDTIITNKAKLPVRIAGFKITGPDSASFTLEPTYLNMTINQNEIKPVGIIFNPVKKGLCKAKIELIGSCGNSVFLDLYGKGLCHSESLDTIRFGTSLVGEKINKTITAVFYNPMTIPVRIRPIIESDANHKNHWRDFKLLSPEPNVLITVNPFSEVDFTIDFTPSALGERVAYINFNIDAGCEIVNSVLIGYGMSGTIKSNSLNFGRERLNYNYPKQDLKIYNIGNTVKTVTEIRFNDDNMKDIFSFPQLSPPIEIAGKDSLVIPLNFVPITDKPYSAEVKFITSEADTAVSILEGDAFLPQLITAKDCDANIKIGDTGTAFIELNNQSTSSELNVNSITLSNTSEFSFQAGNLNNITLQKGETQRYMINYTPKNGESHFTDVMIEADDYDGQFTDTWKTTTIRISCDALKFELTNPLYGATLLCDENTKNLIVKNTSESTTAEIYLSQSIINGPDATNFKLANQNQTIQINGGETVQIPIIFKPTAPRIFNANISIPVSNDIVFDIPLKAEGREIIPSTTPNYIEIFPKDNQTLPFIVDIPDLEKSQIDSLELIIKQSSNALYLNPSTFKSSYSAIKWSPIEYTKEGDLILKGKGNIPAPLKKEIFTLKYSGMLDDSTSTTLTYEVKYNCTNRDFIVQKVKIKEVCVQDLRLIIVNNYNYSISKPTPNPSSEQINLKFSLAIPSKTKIEIYNIEGKMIKQLLNEELKAGNYDKYFGISELSTGSYIIKIDSGEFSQSVPLQIVK